MNAAAQPDISLEDFEAGNVDAAAFDHEAHVYVAWLFLDRYSSIEALSRFTTALRRLTRQLGVPDKYHATITWFFMLLIAERRDRMDQPGWFAFRRRNADVFQAGTLLRRYYSRSLLESPQARRGFVLPDRAGA